MWTAPERARPAARRRPLAATQSILGVLTRVLGVLRRGYSEYSHDEVLGWDGRTRSDGRRGRRDHVRDSRERPNKYTLVLGVSRRCGLVVVGSTVQRARAAGDGEHALLPTEAWYSEYSQRVLGVLATGTRSTRNGYSEYAQRVLGVRTTGTRSTRKAHSPPVTATGPPTNQPTHGTDPKPQLRRRARSQTRNAYVVWRLQRTTPRAACKKCASASSKHSRMQADDGKKRGGALLRLVMRGDNKGRGECDDREKGDLQTNNPHWAQTEPMRAHRCRQALSRATADRTAPMTHRRIKGRAGERGRAPV
jgi:hypothetical protein